MPAGGVAEDSVTVLLRSSSPPSVPVRASPFAGTPKGVLDSRRDGDALDLHPKPGLGGSGHSITMGDE